MTVKSRANTHNTCAHIFTVQHCTAALQVSPTDCPDTADEEVGRLTSDQTSLSMCGAGWVAGDFAQEVGFSHRTDRIVAPCPKRTQQDVTADPPEGRRSGEETGLTDQSGTGR